MTTFHKDAVIVTCCLLVLAGAMVAVSQQHREMAGSVACQIIGLTNGNLVVVQLSNGGQRPILLHPGYGFETEPPKVDASMVGNWLPISSKALLPGEHRTTTLPLPKVDGRPWRLGFHFREQRSPFKAFVHFWLMQADLASREEDWPLEYSEWVTNGIVSHEAAGTRR